MFYLSVLRTEPSSADSEPAKLLQKVEIPLNPKPSALPSSEMSEVSSKSAKLSLESAPTTDGASLTGKRKREGEDEANDGSEAPGRPSSKRLATDTSEPIVIDDAEGPISIDD